MADRRVSVIIPTFQRRELVQEAIASALAQTYRDFEVIVVDDGSTDGTQAAVASFDGQIRYIRQENRGPSAARNAGVEIAEGEIIAPLDSDDLWLPNHLEAAVTALDRYPQAVLATTCPSRTVGQPGAQEAQLYDPYPRLLAETFVLFIHGCVIRRNALLEIGGFDERINAGEQHDIYMRLGLLGPFAVIQRKTAIRRAAPDSLHERVRATGGYVDGFEITSETVLRELERRGKRPELIGPARGRVELARALRALHEHKPEVAREALARACELLPSLSDAADWVYTRVRFTTGAGARGERLYRFAAVATLWPRPDAPTAMYLRGYAIALAFRTGRLRRAAALLRRWPWRATPAFVLRVSPDVRRRVARWRYRRRHNLQGARGAGRAGWISALRRRRFRGS